jgi:hypothetical protein
MLEVDSGANGAMRHQTGNGAMRYQTGNGAMRHQTRNVRIT